MATRAVAEEAAKTARLQAGKATPAERDRLTAAAVDAAKLAENISVPPEPRRVADDVTGEAAISLLADHGGRLAIASPEGGVFETMAGRYSNRIPQLDWALKGHAGDTLTVDRKSRPTEHI